MKKMRPHHRSVLGSSLLLLLSVFVLTLSGCGNDYLPTEPKTAVTFIGQAENTTWDNGDRIGVFALRSGTRLQQNNIIDNNSNLPFITDGSGTFHAQTKNIYPPQNGAAMDFIAYYPFIEGITNYTFPINIITQTDFLYSNNLTGFNADANNGNQLNFRRPLSKLIIDMSLIMSDLPPPISLTAVMHGAKTRASFSLADGVLTVDENSAAQIPLIISSNGTNQKQISMLMLPTTASDNIEIRFRAGSNSYTWTLPHALQPGSTHTYAIELEVGEDTGGGEDPDQPITLYQYMEIPAYSRGISPPRTIETRHKVGDRRWLNQSLPLPAGKIRNFTVLFDTENRLPLWVAYPLHPIYLASGNRTDEWTFDPQIPGRHQPFLANRSWQSQIPGQNFDRGHVLPSADRNATRELNRSTFYFTNVVAQNPVMNQGVWLDLEDRVRVWSRENPRDTLYVVTGNILHSPPVLAVADNNGVLSAKPQYMYKALLRRNMTDGTFTSIGFKMSNTDDSLPYTQSVVSVTQLEEITGFTFFPTLPENIAAEVKGNVDIGLF